MKLIMITVIALYLTGVAYLGAHLIIGLIEANEAMCTKEQCPIDGDK